MVGKIEPHRRLALRVVLEAIDRHLGEYQSTAERNEVLARLIAEHDLQDMQRNAAAVVPMTVKRLASVVQTTAYDHPRNGRKGNRTGIWTVGSAMISQRYLTDIGFEPSNAPDTDLEDDSERIRRDDSRPNDPVESSEVSHAGSKRAASEPSLHRPQRARDAGTSRARMPAPTSGFQADVEGNTSLQRKRKAASVEESGGVSGASSPKKQKTAGVESPGKLSKESLHRKRKMISVVDSSEEDEGHSPKKHKTRSVAAPLDAVKKSWHGKRKAGSLAAGSEEADRARVKRQRTAASGGSRQVAEDVALDGQSTKSAATFGAVPQALKGGVPVAPHTGGSVATRIPMQDDEAIVQRPQASTAIASDAARKTRDGPPVVAGHAGAAAAHMSAPDSHGKNRRQRWSPLAGTIGILPQSTIEKEMLGLWRDIQSAAIFILKLDVDGSAAWLTHASPELETLFRQTFGEDYSGRMLAMSEHKVSVFDAVQACIASAIFIDVFSTGAKDLLPWNGPQQLLAMLKGMGTELDDSLRLAGLGCNLTHEQLLWRASQRLADAPATEAQLQLVADQIANKILLVLDPQLALWGSSGRGHKDLIAPAVLRALVLKGRMRAAPHYSEISEGWIRSGVDFDKSSMTEPQYFPGRREVLWCLTPRVRYRETTADEWETAVRARVCARDRLSEPVLADDLNERPGVGQSDWSDVDGQRIDV
ncbi:hypothetical protein LTR53_006885 [Teratosphaeriaceae sp. CCFEE 6253]|nr:hypothetical protein LTR53_006885 [Teratosphaeriaceae sp. CCFEE 6253]